MRIGILQCGHASGALAAHGDYDSFFQDLLRDQGLEFTSYDVEGGQFPDGPRAQEGWLLTGSVHGVYEDHGFIAPLEAFIRAAYGAEVPMVGVCFGHQIIAQALGGRVEKFKGGWGVGPHAYGFDGLGQVHLTAWHQDQVIEPPAGARTLARSDFCQHAALVYGKRALTLQPHPEFSPAHLTTLVKARKGTGTYPDDRMEAALAAADTPLDQRRLARLMGDFFKGQADV